MQHQGDLKTAGRSGRAAASAAAVGCARLTALGTAAVQLPVLTRLLEPGAYGQLAVAIAIATYFNVFADVHTLAFQRFPGTAKDRANYTYAARRIFGTVAAIALVLIASGALFTGNWRFSVAVAGWGFGITATRFVATAWLGWMKPWSYAGSLSVSTAVRTVVLLALVAKTRDPEISLAVAGFTCGLAALLTGPRARWSRRDTDRPPWRLSLGLHLSLTSAAVTLMGNAALLLLPTLEAPDAVGRFAAMTQLAVLTSGAALGLLTTVAYPRLRQAWDAGQHGEVHARLVDTTWLITTISAATLTFLSAGDYWLIRLVVASDHLEVRLVPALVIATALASLATTTSWEHQFRLRVGSLSLRALAACAVGIAVMALLTAQFGLPGATFGVIVLQGTYLLLITLGTLRSGTRSTTAIVLVATGLVTLLTVPRPAAVTAVSAATAAAAAGLLLWRIRARQV